MPDVFAVGGDLLLLGYTLRGSAQIRLEQLLITPTLFRKKTTEQQRQQQSE